MALDLGTPPEENAGPRFGRLPAPDARDRKMLLRAALPARLPHPESRYWSLRVVLDQTVYSGKDASSCVGHAWHAFLRASPVLTREPLPLDIYHEAQRLDEWDGEDYEGTSVRAGARYLTESIKQVVEYRWAFNVDDVVDWLATKGPVVLGIDWMTKMLDTDEKGFIHAEGNFEGGHAILCLGYSDTKKALRLQNSWGKGWGQKGRCWLPYSDADKLIRNGGEACTAIEKARTK